MGNPNNTKDYIAEPNERRVLEISNPAGRVKVLPSLLPLLDTEQGYASPTPFSPAVSHPRVLKCPFITCLAPPLFPVISKLIKQVTFWSCPSTPVAPEMGRCNVVEPPPDFSSYDCCFLFTLGKRNMNAVMKATFFFFFFFFFYSVYSCRLAWRRPREWEKDEK